MLLRFIILFTLIAAIGLAVLYHRPTAQWFHAWQLQQQIDTLLRQRNWQSLRELCERQLPTNPDHPGVLKGLAAYYTYKAGQPHKASTYYAALLKQTPADHGARLAYANLLRQKLHQPQKALQLLYDGSQLQPDGTVFPHQMGNVYLQAAEAATPAGQRPGPTSQRLYKLADTYYQTVLARNPKHYGAWFQAGRAASQLNQWDKAADYFCQCVDLAPTSYRARYNLGYSLMPLGLAAAAKPVLMAAVHSPQADNNMANQLLYDIQEINSHYNQTTLKTAEHRSGVMGSIGAKDWHHEHKPADSVVMTETSLNGLSDRLKACLKKNVPLTIEPKKSKVE
jgi:tetratricopeptide (TPR) repeat protein